MAKVTGPLMSFSASGNTTAGTMQFRTTRTGTHVYQPPDPAKQNQAEPTDKQEAQRLRFKEACDQWSQMSLEEKGEYAARAAAFSLSGFGLFMRESLYLSQE